MPEIIDINFLLKTTYLTLKQNGYSEFSLDDEQLLEYVPKIQKLFIEYGFENSKIFAKNLDTKTYDEYKKFLIQDLCDNKYNREKNTININAGEFYILACQEWAAQYSDIIKICCFYISKDNKFVSERNCENCYYSCYIMKNGQDENLYCDINRYSEYMEPVSPTDFCDEHIFRDDNYVMDEEDLKIHQEFLLRKEEIKKERQKVLVRKTSNY